MWKHLKQPRPVEFTWRDATSTMGWQNVGTQLNCMTIRCRGFLVAYSEKDVLIAMHIAEDGTYNHIFAIPKEFLGKKEKKWFKH